MGGANLNARNVAAPILFNALSVSPEAAGVGRYAFELCRALLAIRNDIKVVVQRGMAACLCCPRDRLCLLPNLHQSWQRILVEQLAVPLQMRGCRLIHFPDASLPLVTSSLSIVTLHDLSFLRFDDIFTRSQRVWKRFVAREALSRATRVVCDSQFTATEAQDLRLLPAEKLRVIYPGVRIYSGGTHTPAAVRNLSTPFVLAVGTLTPRKNLVRLINAVVLLRREGLDLDLVIAGKRGWLFRPVLAASRHHEIAGHVHLCGHCSEAELAWLYRHAKVLAYVSLYEGFGFPPLEAMTHGLPVVAARAGALPEVCASAAYYVDPYSVEDIARGLHAVCTDRTLRAHLIAAGAERWQAFDWSHTATGMCHVYDEVMEDSSHDHQGGNC